jgi:PEP-CTERM motif
LFSAGGSAFNWYSVGSQTYLSANASAGAYNPGEVVGSVSLNTPEPSTWVMMLVGFAGLGYVGHRRARQPLRRATAGVGRTGDKSEWAAATDYESVF